MSVAQWLNNLELQAKSAPRVQGIYSPVAGPSGPADHVDALRVR